MKKTLYFAVAVVAAPICAAQADDITPRAAEPITQDTAIFAVIDRIEGDELTLHLLRTVTSRGTQTIMFVSDIVRATLLPLAAPDSARRASCVSDIAGWGGVARLIRRDSGDQRSNCLAQLHDFSGAAGLPADRIAINMVTTIMLNGDVVMEGPGAAPPSPPYCDYEVDFLKKTWRPFKPVEEGQTHNTCVPDGGPRPMEHTTCRLGNLLGTQWGFTHHGRLIQASACDPTQDNPK